MKLVFSKLNNILQLKGKTIISNIPMCYVGYHNVNNMLLGKVTYFDEEYHVDN